jgi:uncharacterized repeat protein (TIGR01451 family)
MQSPLRRITNTSEEGTSINPSMSGDGRIVAFESTEDIAGAGGFESFRAIRANVAIDPASFLQIGATRAPAPAISQDGSRIAFASRENPLGTNADANSEIFLYDGAKLIQVTNTSPGDVASRIANGNFLPSISDDGRYIAFSSNRNLANQNADGNLEVLVFDTIILSFTQLTNSSGSVGSSDAKISGNGALVAHIRDAGTAPSAKRDLLLQSRDGSSPSRVLATDVQSLAMTHGRAISDDGTRVVWAAETATNTTQLFLFDGRNNATRQITTLGSRATDVPLHPTISGDGSRIAFATRRSFLGNSDGSVDLYSYDVPSASFGRITSGPSTATADVLSSLNDDGSVVAFNFPRVLSGVSNSDFANNSEIYVTGTPARPASGTLTVLNGASFGNEPATTEAVAPDSIAVARGSVLSNTAERSQQLPNGAFPLTVGGTTVTVNGRRAQIFFVSPSQVNFLVPPETELGTAEVVVTNSDGFPSRGAVTTLRCAPGVFTFSGDGFGDGVVLDANTLLPGPFDPTSGTLRLIIFSTGMRNGSQVSVTAGGRALTLESIVPSPTMPGLDEVHVLVPADLRGAGKVDLVIRADSRDSNPAAVNFVGDAKRDIVINEFLADPPDAAAGDANRDGLRSTSDDEFVELVSTTTHDIDISGYQILTRGTGASDTVRHTFASGTILPACTAIVVFGGGNPSPDNPAFGGGQILKASSGSLTLINSTGVITLRDQAATIVNFVSYGGSTGLDGDANQSVTRSPDTTGAFALHQSASGSGGSPFSPGTRVSGTAFTPCPPIARVEVLPSSATVEAGGQQQFTARAFDTGGNEVTGVIFSWQSSNPSAVATIDQNGRATAVAAGLTQIRASGRGIQSAPATLTVNPAIPILTSVTISPATATTGVGETQQFAAQAKDQFGQNIGGVTITFNSNNTAIATVDMVTATSASGSATATVTGRASGAAQITATANNGDTSVTSSPATLTVEPGAGQLLISEFRTRGPSGASDEFIEIYNPTLSTLTIGGLKIRASNSAGAVSDRVTIPAGTTLLSARHYLVTNSTANTGYSGPVAGNQTYATGIADDGGIAITGSNGTSIIDAVGMSSGSAYKEGATLAPLANNVNQSYERKPGGAAGNGKDTNNNASDFFLNASSSNPQNLDSAGLNLDTADLSITKTDSPDPVPTGSDVIYTITVINNGPGTAQSVVVTDNLPASLTFVSCAATDGGACGGTGNNRMISFSSLASGSSAVITLIANANGAGGTVVVNTGTVTSATLDPVPGNNSATANTNVQAPLSSLTINDVTANEGDAGTTTFTFTVSLSSPAPDGGITFDIATADGTAQDHNPISENNDYTARFLTAQTIPAGQQTYTFDISVNGDLLVEGNETLFVNVTNVSGAASVDGQGLGTIQNDDTADLAISQLYGGGGNSGAPYTNDFVEVFNRGTATVNFAVTPYSIQYAGATSNFGSNKIDLTSGIIAPGKYFLVKLASGGATGAVLPAADANGGINMAATAGKVALVVGTTALNAASCPTGAPVSDLVGYGTTADCFEGLGRAPAPSATAADFRKADGCQDTDDNAADLLVSAPFPRNSSSPANNCTGPVPALTINDVSANEGNGPTTFTFTVTLSSPAPAGGVSFDIATADGSATDGNPAGEDNDYVGRSFTSQTIVAGNLAYTFEVTVNGDLKTEANETFFVNLSNVSGATVADGQALGTIQNDDVGSGPTLSINDVSMNEGNAGTTTFTLTVQSSSPAPAGGITFDIATQDSSATIANNDYVARALTAQTIPAGQQTYVFAVTVNGDLLLEPNETFLVNVTNVSGATLADGQGLGTILNDDNANLVISQVYGGGGNVGALFANDFVELFNRGTTIVNFASTPYSIQYAGANANFGSNKVDLTSGMIGPGQYFLVQLSSGGPNGAPLPAADAGGGINMAATAGKVSLVVGTASLPASTCPGDDGVTPLNPSNATIADFVGYGSSAVCYEGPTGPAPAPSATAADFRKRGGCTDTDDNAADFLTASPLPRNSSSLLNDCGAAPPGTPSLAINDVTLLEGNSGASAATFTVSLSAPAPAGGVSFDIATQDGSATAASGDYVSKTLAGQLIPAGQQSYTFDVVVNGDVAAEPDETFLVNLTNVSGATLADGQGVGTIQNDDPPALSIDDVFLTEGNSGTKAFTFTVSLSAPATTPVTFDISTADGTAQDDVPPSEDNDYVARSLTTQVVPAGSQTYAFTVTVIGDLKIEQTETFFVNITNTSGATVARGQGQGTIVNDDVARLSIDDVSLNEGNTGTTIFTFTVKSSLPAPVGGITFDIATSDVTAQDDNPVSEDNDYAGRSLTGQTIPAGQQTYLFNVTVNGDTKVESDETFLVNITNVSNVLDGQGVGTIKNDDVVSRVEVSPSSATINRGNLQQFTPTAFDGGNQPTPVGSFTWESSNTAVAAINSNGVATGVGIGTTTITATTSNGMGGTVSGTATMTVHVPLVINETLPQVPLDNSGTSAIEGDSNRDGVRSSDDDEFVELLNNSNTSVDISGVIVSDSTSNRFTFPANTILAAGRAVVVFGGGSPPVNDPAFGGALILTASSLGLGDTGDSITVKLPVAGSDVVIDSLVYGTGNPVPAPGAQSLTRSPDAAIGSAGGGYVTHTTATNAAGRVFSPGTRADGTPFGSPPITLVEVAPAAATVGIGASQLFTGHAYSNGIEVLNVSFIWDSSDTSKAAVTPTMGRTTTATAIAAGSPAIRVRAGGQQGNATLIIDPTTPTLTINDVSATEGNAGPTTFTFMVSLSGPAPSGGVSFDIATADGSAQDGIPVGEDNDYVARTLTGQTIPAGNTNYTFSVTVNGDLVIESNETFSVNVTNISGATIGDAQGLGTIQNDDSPTLNINDVSASETDGVATTFTFTVTSSSPAPAGGITFDIATADGTAQDDTPASEDNDYVARALTGQTIPAGNTTYMFAVTVNGDLVVEPNETFFVNVTNVSGATLSDGQGLGTIHNDDTANLVISQVYAGGGNAGAQFTNDFVEVFNHGTTTVNFATTPYSIQYAGATSSFGSSKVDLTSGTIGPGKYFLVQLSGGANGSPLPTPDASGSIAMAATAGKVALVAGTTTLTGSGCPLAATVADFVGYGTTANCSEGPGRAPAPSNTTADFRKAGGCTDNNDNAIDFLVSAPFPRNSSSPSNNCAAGAAPNLTINDVTVTEGNSGTTTATFTVSLSVAAPSTDISFDIATQNNTATTANSDYVAKTLTGQIIPAGEPSYTFTVTINGDVAIENDESFFVNVTNVSGATLADGQGVGTIHNDDLPALTINNVSATEGNSGPKTFTFTVSLSSPAPTGGVTFDVATADDTAQDDNPATEDNDYVAQTVVAHTIPAGSSTYDFAVTVNGDLVIEPDETFFVNVTNVTGAMVGDNQGLGTIQNDDNPALSINDVTVTEGDSGTTTAGFTVTLSPSSNQIVTVNYATANGTALAPGDYQTTSGMLTFNPGETTKPINVLVNGDTANEAICETFFVNLSVPTGGATIFDPQGQGSITDNDGTKLVISQIYGGGGNGGASYTHDFIELFNRGNTAISLNGMSVQYAPATGTSGTYDVTILPNVMLQPGQYFLIQEASGGAAGSPLPNPDVITGTIAMAATAGRVALVSSTIALNRSACPGGPSLLDFIGYGTTAICREGSTTADNAPAPSVTNADIRKQGGCQDVGNNFSDFLASAASPRNTLTPVSTCSCSTSYSSTFMVPGLGQWQEVLALLSEDAHLRPRDRSGYAERSH